MSLWDKFVRAVNPQIEDKAEEILEELKAEGYKAYPNSQHVVPSFRIMEKSEDSTVSERFRAGLITKVRIGSDLMEAKWAVEGNGPGRIYPSKKKALAFYGHGKYAGGGHGKGGKYVLPSVASYKGKDFVEKVANRHR